jgi:hypothetical protein
MLSSRVRARAVPTLFTLVDVCILRTVWRD